MKVELTFAQLNKISRLSPESWKAFLSLIKEGGSGDFSPSLSEVKEFGLIQKEGPCVYVKFPVDGAYPQHLPQVAKRNKNHSEFGAFMAVWRSKSKEYMTGADMGALKRFVNNYSIEEFKELLRLYHEKQATAALTLREMWTIRNKFGKKFIDVFAGDSDD